MLAIEITFSASFFFLDPESVQWGSLNPLDQRSRVLGILGKIVLWSDLNLVYSAHFVYLTKPSLVTVLSTSVAALSLRNCSVNHISFAFLSFLGHRHRTVGTNLTLIWGLLVGMLMTHYFVSQRVMSRQIYFLFIFFGPAAAAVAELKGSALS